MKNVFVAVLPDFGPHFGFHATSLEDAQQMITKWNRYHSYNTRCTKAEVRPLSNDDYEFIRNAGGDDFMAMFV